MKDNLTVEQSALLAFRRIPNRTPTPPRLKVKALALNGVSRNVTIRTIKEPGNDEANP